ncbi:MAG: PAS domain S-box protein, partial [Leptolyngbyaceae cyanobacterium bins.59]|nr:PAS domain S-box protein [Leptolyngbyaceae cyanobacterium bins.59]
YYQAIRKLEPIVQAFPRTSPTDLQQQSFNRLKFLVQQRIVSAEQSIVLFRKNPNLQLQVPITERGKVIQDEIRALVAELIRAEEQTLRSLERDVQQQTQKTTLVFLGGFSLSLAIFVFFYSKLERQIAQQERTEHQLKRMNRSLRTLSSCNQTLIRATEETPFLQEICQNIIEIGGYRMAWVGFIEPDEAKTIRPVAWAGYESGYLESVQLTWADRERGRGPGGTAIRTRKTTIVQNILDDPNFAPWQAEANRHGYAAVISIPLQVDTQLYGILTIYASQPNAFNLLEIELLEELAADTAYGIFTLRSRQLYEQTQVMLHRREEELRMATQAAQIGTWNWNLLTGEINWSQSHADLFGISLDEFDGRYETFATRIHPADLETLNQKVSQAIQSRESYRYEYRVMWPDGSLHWVEGRGHAFYDESGQPVRMTGTILGIDDRKQAELALQQAKATLEVRVQERTAELQTANAQLQQELLERQRTERALRDSEEQFRSTFENAPIGMAIVDLEGRFLRVNDALCRIVGYSKLELLERGVPDITHPEDRAADLERAEQFIRGDVDSCEFRYRYLHKQGHIVWVSVSSCLVRDHAGQPLHFLGQISDVTEQQAIEQMKNEFISVVSHELRTPLTSIRGSISLLAAGVLANQPAKAQRMLEIAAIDTERLVRLVNDILDLERLEAGQAFLLLERCEVLSLLRAAITGLQAIADRSEVTLVLEEPPDPLFVRAASDRILQTLTNLIGNAIKFSPPHSTVTLTARAFEDACVLFSVHDRGRGIPADKLEAIFGRFQQVDASDSRQKGGTGLGLAICRNIIQQHGGRIWAESTLEEGSTFYFTLPIAQE